MTIFRRTERSVGKQGEDAAATFLKRAGYRILARNVQLAGREVDIIAQYGDTVVFVEVKTRSGDDTAFRPEDNLSPRQQQRLIQAAGLYLQQRRDPELNCRFDVVSVTIPTAGKPQVEHFQDAFRAK